MGLDTAISGIQWYISLVDQTNEISKEYPMLLIQSDIQFHNILKLVLHMKVMYLIKISTSKPHSLTCFENINVFLSVSSKYSRYYICLVFTKFLIQNSK